ncbi:hypothetical protein FJTKL_12004 [Diaporthe vaccinii]|uniref:Uncharacterized protein n=1 Tax=Diaporthe vaccinii TaxID=105482 RepID=A0ABR4FAY1_9PEZI
MIRHVGPPEHRTISGASLSEIVAYTYPLSKQGRPNRSKRDQVFAEKYKKIIIGYRCCAFWTRFMACLSVSYDDFEIPVRNRVVTNIDTQGFHSVESGVSMPEPKRVLTPWCYSLTGVK